MKDYKPTYRRVDDVYITRSGKAVTWRKVPENRVAALLEKYKTTVATVLGTAGLLGGMYMFSVYMGWVYRISLT